MNDLQLPAWLSGNLGTIMFLGAIVYFVIWANRKRKQAGSVIERFSDSGSVQGNSVPSKEYSGRINDIIWKLSTVYERIRSSNSTRSGARLVQNTRWESASVKFPVGKFLMLMRAEGYQSSRHPMKHSEGFLGNILNMAAEGFLDVYVTGYFGPQYKPLVNVEGSAKIDKANLDDFLILTNYEGVSRKFLSDETARFIATWDTRRPAFTHESLAKQFGMLFSTEGMILSCKGAMMSDTEVNTYSQFGVELASRMKGTL
ncbi:MAG: hypothetical protein JST46_16865 [Bacteroidetes bacterium]|nr:hypothetical protein [Bacteroidota bacterium]